MAFGMGLPTWRPSLRSTSEKRQMRFSAILPVKVTDKFSDIALEILIPKKRSSPQLYLKNKFVKSHFRALPHLQIFAYAPD